MSKFKIGDKVKIVNPNLKLKNKFINEVRKIHGTDGMGWYYLDDTEPWRWHEEELELVEEPKITATAIKLDSNEIKITANSIICSNIIGEILNDKKVIKKEGINMIESLNLVDLYANKQRENIEKGTKEKIVELRKKCDVINKYNELVETFKKDCDELYLSQFTEEEKQDIIADKLIGDADKQLQRSAGPLYRYIVNNLFIPEGYEELMDNRQEKLDEISDLVKTVKSHVAIAKTKEEVEEILKRYEILDKKSGKLVTK